MPKIFNILISQNFTFSVKKIYPKLVWTPCKNLLKCENSNICRFRFFRLALIQRIWAILSPISKVIYEKNFRHWWQWQTWKKLWQRTLNNWLIILQCLQVANDSTYKNDVCSSKSARNIVIKNVARIIWTMMMLWYDVYPIKESLRSVIY